LDFKLKFFVESLTSISSGLQVDMSDDLEQQNRILIHKLEQWETQATPKIFTKETSTADTPVETQLMVAPIDDKQSTEIFFT
jgi:hypothetical protein